jgi:ADP-heptose:LPS heptosyltransferase
MGVSLNPTAIGKSLAEITIAVNQSLEKNLLESPLDGFWMHHRWKATANFAPRDPKVNKILAGMDLIPFRIIVVAPESLADAVAAVPMVRALRAARCDIEVMVACHRDQESFWKTVEAVSRVLPYADYKELRDQLWLPELYNIGPYDAAILLDQSKSIAKAFAPFMPVSFFGLETHPLSKKLRFRIKAKTVTKDGKDQHRIEDYMGIAKKCSLETDTASFYPSVSQEGKQGTAVAWDGNRQIIEQIRTLPEDLQKQLKLVCLDGQKASLASFNLASSVVSGDAGTVVAELRQAATVIADGSTMVALANYAGAKCLAVMPDSETKKYRPWGEGHQMVTPQQVAEILRSCATLQEARVND